MIIVLPILHSADGHSSYWYLIRKAQLSPPSSGQSLPFRLMASHDWLYLPPRWCIPPSVPDKLDHLGELHISASCTGKVAHGVQGMISILSLSLMYLSSIRAVRQRIYEFFLIAHICLAALFLAGVIMHWSAVSLWVYVSLYPMLEFMTPADPLAWYRTLGRRPTPPPCATLPPVSQVQSAQIRRHNLPPHPIHHQAYPAHHLFLESRPTFLCTPPDSVSATMGDTPLHRHGHSWRWRSELHSSGPRRHDGADEGGDRSWGWRVCGRACGGTVWRYKVSEGNGWSRHFRRYVFICLNP